MKRIILFVVAFAIWLLLNLGAERGLLLLGLPVALLVTILTGNLFPNFPISPMRYLMFVFWYLPVFLWEMVKSDFYVAYRVIHPSLPIRPGIVRIKTELKSDTALTFLANSITLRLGNMTVDVDKEKGILYVHCFYVPSLEIEEATRVITGRFEPILKRIFE